MEPKDKQWASQEKKKELSNIMSIVSSLFFLGLPGYSEPTKWPMVTLSSGAAISPFLYMILFVFLSLSLFHTHTHTLMYSSTDYPILFRGDREGMLGRGR